MDLMAANQHQRSFFRLLVGFLIFPILLIGCASVSKGPRNYPQSQITRGKPVYVIDFLGSTLSIPIKLILWNQKFNNHSISNETEAKLLKYLEKRKKPVFEETAFRLNEYAPFADLKSLVKN